MPLRSAFSCSEAPGVLCQKPKIEPSEPLISVFDEPSIGSQQST